MSLVKISGNASGTGTLTIAAPNTNTDYTLTLPQATTTIVGTDATQTLTNKTIQGGGITSGTVVTASTTIVDFTNIPSWVKRVTVLFNGVSGSGTSNLLLQLGAGSIVTSGYNSGAHTVNTSNTSSTAGLLLTSNSVSTTAYYGIINLVTMGSNVWVSSHNFGAPTGNYNNFGGGSVTLSGSLDRLRITTVNGTDTFDAGTINIMYE
jgi:hypothetical protein